MWCVCVCVHTCSCMGTHEGNRQVSGALSQGSHVAQASSGLSLLSSRKAQATHPVQDCPAVPPGSSQPPRNKVQPPSEGGLGLDPQSKGGSRSSWSPRRPSLLRRCVGNLRPANELFTTRTISPGSQCGSDFVESPPTRATVIDRLWGQSRQCRGGVGDLDSELQAWGWGRPGDHPSPCGWSIFCFSWPAVRAESHFPCGISQSFLSEKFYSWVVCLFLCLGIFPPSHLRQHFLRAGKMAPWVKAFCRGVGQYEFNP